MSRKLSRSWKLLPALLLVAAASTASAQEQEADGLEDLRKEIATLKAGQAAMRRQLAEIKALIEKGGGGGRQANQNQVPDVTLDLAGYPTLGEGNAVLTLVEFSDFQ